MTSVVEEEPMKIFGKTVKDGESKPELSSTIEQQQIVKIDMQNTLTSNSRNGRHMENE